MDNSHEGAPSKGPIKELVGPPPPRRPIPSNSFNTLVKICSLFPDQNPFSEYASYAKLPGYLRRCHDNLNNPRPLRSVDLCNDGVAPRGEKEASDELVGSATVEAWKLSVHDEGNNKEVAEDLCNDVSCCGSKLMTDELGGLNENKTMNKKPSDEEGTITGMADELIMDELGNSTNRNKTIDKMPFDEVGVSVQMAEVNKVHEELSGIERILMNESDDFGVSQLLDKGVNFDFLNDFSSILDTDVCGNKSMTIGSRKSGEPSVAGNMKGDVEGEKKRKDVEVNRSTSGGDEAKSRAHLSAVSERSDCREIVKQCVNTRPGEAQRKERKLCKENFSQNFSEYGGLTFAAQKSENERGTVSNGVRKGNQIGLPTKGKTKRAMDKSVKDVNSGKNKLSPLSGGTSYSMKYGGADLAVLVEVGKQNVYGNTGKFSAKKGENDPKRRERFQFSREELLNLRKTSSLPEEILKTIREIGAEVHGKDQNCVAGKLIDPGVVNKEMLVAPAEGKMAEEKGSSILNKKRGSSSEAKKEKKKRKKRKKRAEMNKKLGVKRLKLKPVVKPKVIAICRHYLKGRCQEGESCKFSHDVIPLTKSKPCCHFARQACMKGDDCPFDHQLSNYPCNTYVATGFCSRGDSCLFSHKISAKEGSETVADVSKCETTSLDQLDKSNFKQQVNANPSSSGIATPKSLKEDSAKQPIQPAKAPKGLSFLSSGKSSLKDSGNHNEADLSQKIGGAAGTSGQPNIATTSTINLIKTLMDTPPSDTREERGFLSFVKASVGSSGHKTPADPSFHWVNPSFAPEKSLLQESAKHDKMRSSKRSADASGTSNQLNKAMPSRLSEVNLASMSPKPISAPSSGEPLYNHGGGKSQAALPSTGNPDPLIREKENATGSEKAIQQKQCGSSTSSGQCSTKGGVKNAPNTAQRALLSTLVFAAKFESGIKMTSAATSKVAKDEGTSSSSSGCRQNEPSKASAILEFLYGGGKKENSEAGM